MKLAVDQRIFLERVESFNDEYNALKTGDQTSDLDHSFWAIDEINESHADKVDWDVPSEMVPFYGDWHDLLCLNTNDGSIAQLDDKRTKIHLWPNVESFVQSLVWVDELPSEGGKNKPPPGSWLAPDLLDLD